MSSSAENIKQVAHQLIDQLPENSTWDDVLYQMAVRRSIEMGIAESEQEEGFDTDFVRSKFGLK